MFAESQIYRIDHYLGKETVQNVLALRFGNSLFEPLWARGAVDHVQITVAENLGVGQRFDFYNRTGALRDMVQNHMLQLLCMIAMEPPASMDHDDIRNEKIKVLRALKSITPEVVDRYWELARYPGNRAATRQRFSMPRTSFDAAMVEQVQVPALVMWGREDALIPYAAAGWYMEHLPDATLAAYPGIGHLPMEEAADRSVADLKAWLEKVRLDREAENAGTAS